MGGEKAGCAGGIGRWVDVKKKTSRSAPIIKGYFDGYDEGTVIYDGMKVALGPSLELANHSPYGFAWGYAGSGPAQLALALLMHAGVSYEEALEWYQDLKQTVIEDLPHNEAWKMPVAKLESWIDARRQGRIEYTQGQAANPGERPC